MAYRTRPGETQHQARERIARAKGFASYRKYRTAGAGAREAATGRLAARDPGYRERARGAAKIIRTRQRMTHEGPDARAITTTSMRRLRAVVRDAGRANLQFHMVIRVEDFDRRYRDARRRRGRETGLRTLQARIFADELDTRSVDEFTEDFEAWVDSLLENLYSGLSHGWRLVTLTVVVPRAGRRAA